MEQQCADEHFLGEGGLRGEEGVSPRWGKDHFQALRSESARRKKPERSRRSQTNKVECTRATDDAGHRFFAVPRVERWTRDLILQCRASSRSLTIVHMYER